jgi:hypothetical protein
MCPRDGRLGTKDTRPAGWVDRPRAPGVSPGRCRPPSNIITVPEIARPQPLPLERGVAASAGAWHRAITPFGSNRKETQTMAKAINRHDARALALIDRALADGRFSADSVAQIHRAFEAARHEERSSPAPAAHWSQREAA